MRQLCKRFPAKGWAVSTELNSPVDSLMNCYEGFSCVKYFLTIRRSNEKEVFQTIEIVARISKLICQSGKT